MLKTFGFLAAIIVPALIITACSKEPTLEVSTKVNDENCRAENITKIKEVDARQAFASKCFNRGEFKNSPKKEW